MAEKLILLELNEVPYRIIDYYCALRPRSSLASVAAMSRQYETVTEDKIALDPWISWATLHRGVTDERHMILHLGQVDEEIDSAFPPIWRRLREQGLKVGVFGSLHSSNVPRDVDTYSFYLPDYFAAEGFAHPEALRWFQRLNLSMTRQSARNVTRAIPGATLARFLATAPMLGVTSRTMLDVAGHLARETFNPDLRIRRRAYQPLIMADLFLCQLRRTRPDFATFYTNHVAAAMHRYWGAAFPEDYTQPLDEDWRDKYAGEIAFAMDKFDVMLRKFVRFVDRNPEYRLAIASSMGQAAIPASKNFEFLTVIDVGRLMTCLGVPPEGWSPRPAMVPVQCFLVQDQYRDAVLSGLASLEVDGVRIRKDRRPVAPLSFDERQRGFFQLFVQFDGYRNAPKLSILGRDFGPQEAGFGLMAHEDGVNCTAQHVPDGSLLIYPRKQAGGGTGIRERVPTTEFVPSIMSYFGRGSGAAAIRFAA